MRGWRRPSQGPGFAQESFVGAGRRLHPLARQLERHLALQQGIERPIDRSVTAFSQDAQNLKPAQARTLRNRSECLLAAGRLPALFTRPKLSLLAGQVRLITDKAVPA